MYHVIRKYLLFRNQMIDHLGSYEHSSAERNIFNFSSGLPDPQTFQRLDGLRNMQGTHSFSSNDIDEFKNRLAQTIGLTKENMLITNGVSQALELITHQFIAPGDVVLTEDPCYLGALQIFSAAGAKIIQLGIDEEGVSISELSDTLVRFNNIRFFYTVPIFHNPTGRCITPKRAVEVARLLNLYGTLIIQDLIYLELVYEMGFHPTLFPFDQSISLYSFSKIASPAFKIGVAWHHASDLSKIENLAARKQDNSDAVENHLMRSLLFLNVLESHIVFLRHHYQQKRDYLHSLLQHCEFCEQNYHIPKGGFSFWVKLSVNISPIPFIERLWNKQKIRLIPGERYGPASSQYVRLCFGYMPMEKLKEGIHHIESYYKKLK